MNELLKRSITGAAFVLVMISTICLSIYSLAAILLFILISGAGEYINLVGLNEEPAIKRTVIFSSVFIFIVVFIVRLGILPPIFILYSILPLIFIDIIIIKRSAKNFYNVLFKTTGAYIYLVLPLSLSLYLIKYQHPSYNGTLLITILALIWVYDSFAYLIGSVLGKHKILPSISPKKSWEGLIGGYLFMSLAAYLFSTKILTDYKMYEIAIMCSIIVVAGTCGDFFESYLKRKSGLKDSGNCLPGHGGILDRFDSYFFIIPAIYLFLKLI